MAYIAAMGEKGATVKGVRKTIELLEEKIGGDGGGGIALPENDGKYYAMKDGEWAELRSGTLIVAEPSNSVAAGTPLTFSWVKRTLSSGVSSNAGEQNPIWVESLSCFFAVVKYSSNSTRWDLKTSTDGISWSTVKTSICTSGAASMVVSTGSKYLYFACVEDNKAKIKKVNLETKSVSEYATGKSGMFLCYSPTLRRTVIVGALYADASKEILYIDDDDPETVKQAVTPTVTENINIAGGLCWSPTLELFCALVYGSKGYYALLSSDGINWERVVIDENESTNRQFYALCWSEKLKCFCASQASTGAIIVSTDGRTWVLFSEYAISGIGTAFDMIFIDELGVFCRCGNDKKVYISYDCKHWAQIGEELPFVPRSLVWAPQLSRLLASGLNETQYCSMDI